MSTRFHPTLYRCGALHVHQVGSVPALVRWALTLCAWCGYDGCGLLRWGRE